MIKLAVNTTIKLVEFCGEHGLDYKRIDLETAVDEMMTLVTSAGADLSKVESFTLTGGAEQYVWDTLMKHCYDMIPTEIWEGTANVASIEKPF